MDLYLLWELGERVRDGARLGPEDKRFVRETVPQELEALPGIFLRETGRPGVRATTSPLKLPSRVRHPAGFSVSGAVVGTLLRTTLITVGQGALGRRYGSASWFYDRIEADLAFGVMRSHFQHGDPEGTYCCAQCTLAVYPLLQSGAIRWFDGGKLAPSVRAIIEARQWRFTPATNPAMIRWALAA